MSTAEAKTEPTRHPPDIVEAAHVVLDPRCDSLRLALAVKRLNEGTGWVILGRHETLLEASARVLRDALACAEAEIAQINSDHKIAILELEGRILALRERAEGAESREDLATNQAKEYLERAEKAERELVEANVTILEYLTALSSLWDWKRNSTESNSCEMAAIDEAIEKARIHVAQKGQP